MSDASKVTSSVSAVDRSTADAVATYVHEHREAYVEFVSRLVRAESPSTVPGAQWPVQRKVAGALSDLGFETTHLPGDDTGGSLYARPAGRGGRGRWQLLLGHGDTVWPQGTLDEMPVDADGEILRGPGVFDMKAGLASIVFALRALRALDLTPSVRPLVLVTSDEEIGSPESQRHIDRLARTAERVYVLEPALGPEGRLKTARKGTGELELHVRPTPAAAESTVVLELSRLVQRLYDLQAPARGITINVGTIDTDPDGEGRLGVDVRVPSQDDARTLEQAIEGIEADADAVEVDVYGGMERPPLERTPGNRRLWQLAEGLGGRLGLDLDEGGAGGASDGNFTSQHTATLDGLGAVGAGAHADHEFIHVDKTLDRCALLALLLLAPSVSRDGGG